MMTTRIEMISFPTPEAEAAYRKRQARQHRIAELEDEIANADELDRLAELEREAERRRRQRGRY